MIDATRSTHNQEIIDSYVIGYNKGKLDSKIKFIEKACEWLNNEFLQNQDIDGHPNVESRSCVSVEELIQNFRKAME